MKKILLLLLLLPIRVKAASTIVMDIDSNRILYSNNIHDVRSVASISKIMTAIVAIENGDLDEEVIIGNEIEEAYGSGIYIQQDEEIKLIDLLYGLMLRSGNDAALAIAYNVSGSIGKFVSLMNEKASSIGMKNTVFNNPSGLDSDKGNYSSAYDMAVLTSYAMKNKTYEKIVRTKKYKVTTSRTTYLWMNKNKLLNMYKYTTGGKTGFTEKAKRTLVTTAYKDNLHLVTVTLNDGNDFENHKRLYEEKFEEYNSFKILKKGTINIIDENHYKRNSIYLENDFSYPLNKSEQNNIILKFEVEKKYNYKNKELIGKIKVLLGDEVIYEDVLYVKLQKEKITIWQLMKKWLNGK